MYVDAPAGIPYVIQSYISPGNWMTIATNLNGGPINFTYSNSTNLPLQFYRTVQ